MRHWRSNPHRAFRELASFQRARVPPSGRSPWILFASRIRITAVWRCFTGVIIPVPCTMKLPIVSSFRRRFQYPWMSRIMAIPMRLYLLIVWRRSTSCSTSPEQHTVGGTLGLIFTRSDKAVESVEIDPPGIISDHGLVSFYISTPIHPIRSSNKFVRSWRGVAIRNSHIGGPPTSSDPFNLWYVRCHHGLMLTAETSAGSSDGWKINIAEQKTSWQVDDKLAWIESIRQKHRSFSVKENA